MLGPIYLSEEMRYFEPSSSTIVQADGRRAPSDGVASATFAAT